MHTRPSLRLVQRRRLIVRGQVQGVGFRPFIYRLANELGLGGCVRNDGVGATVELEGPSAELDGFIRRLRRELPPMARIDRLDQQTIPPLGQRDFQILHSDGSGRSQVDVAFDIATCPDCLAELFDPADRRHGYPFINCTNCGPRYTIVREVPYDRPTTTMSAFTMCPRCQAEYDDPADRRFHAQPNACAVCGPTIWLAGPTGERLAAAEPGEVVRSAAEALKAGQIVAIRGVGGFHLAVRADQDEAVLRLRQRKNREHKPLAVMVRGLADAERLVELSPASRNELTGPVRPIVIAPRRTGASLSRHVAAGTDALGVMLPYTPLHHLLFAELGELPLVMTSGNLSDEPILAGNEEALAGLGQVADLFLLHNRQIARRLDDSVVQAAGAAIVPLRRARGFVPVGMDLPLPVGSPGLAVGAELKSTVAVVRERGRLPQAILSEHVGDLKDGRVYRHFQRVVAHLLQITHVEPAWIAHDLHPLYLSTSWAGRQGVRLIGVQHHHAHVAACLAEHGRTGPVIGLAADGVGYGDDGTIWGGEVLIADLAGFRRIGRVRPIGLPGGDAAAVRTARPALGWLFDATDGRVPESWLDRLMPDRIERDIVVGQLADGFNCPRSSALGRYFDAAAALLGLTDCNRFEAEAPLALEAAVEPGGPDVMPYRIVEPAEEASPSDGGLAFEIDLRPTVLAMVGQLESGGGTVGQLAAAFHNTVAEALADAAIRSAELTGLATVALSGGVFCNRYLSVRLAETLTGRGLEVLTHRQVPPNDGGLALGQAAVGAARAAGVESRTSDVVTR